MYKQGTKEASSKKNDLLVACLRNEFVVLLHLKNDLTFNLGRKTLRFDS